MKTVSLHFEQEQYNRLIKAKGDMTWIDFVMTLAEGK